MKPISRVLNAIAAMSLLRFTPSFVALTLKRNIDASTIAPYMSA